jgi:hypothetical protein
VSRVKCASFDSALHSCNISACTYEANASVKYQRFTIECTCCMSTRVSRKYVFGRRLVQAVRRLKEWKKKGTVATMVRDV